METTGEGRRGNPGEFALSTARVMVSSEGGQNAIFERAGPGAKVGWSMYNKNECVAELKIDCYV